MVLLRMSQTGFWLTAASLGLGILLDMRSQYFNQLLGSFVFQTLVTINYAVFIASALAFVLGGFFLQKSKAAEHDQD